MQQKNNSFMRGGGCNVGDFYTVTLVEALVLSLLLMRERIMKRKRMK